MYRYTLRALSETRRSDICLINKRKQERKRWDFQQVHVQNSLKF
jgi:hypothetical protein